MGNSEGSQFNKNIDSHFRKIAPLYTIVHMFVCGGGVWCGGGGVCVKVLAAKRGHTHYFSHSATEYHPHFEDVCNRLESTHAKCILKRCLISDQIDS